ncbi:phage portal protein [Falsiroseomonas selenitidurans]|uniref:Phage portal protein n=1 Tax=Falsiroseomonas selenitidurans TaxID=2716335 RepID=A0ABX1DZ56_9PROT|nr:phage portal protein [Falsiroseomonas selenitidurans]NKC30197.1 phage portal protein [Falsiroseomonas selenitidurans]
MLTGLAKWWLERKAVSFTSSWVEAIFAGAKANSGVQVSTNSALQQTAMLRAIMVKADISQIPLVLRRRQGKGAVDAADHYLYDMMLHQPNGWMDGVEWVRTTIMHFAATGQAISYRNIDRRGRIRELIPIRPECAAIDVNTMMEMEYTLQLENAHQVKCGRDQVFHFRGPSWDGFRGLDPVALGREALGLAQATEKSQAQLHQNGVRANGLFKLAGKPPQEEKDRVREMIAATYTGANAGRPILASDALSFEPLTMKGSEAETIQTRGFQIEEIARLQGVFTIMLGHAGDQSPTFASAEAFFGAHVRYTYQPLIRAFLAALNTQLLTREERAEGLHFEMDTSELLRGSLRDRAEYYKAAIGNASQPGWLTPNEIRIDDEWNEDPSPRMNQVQFPMTMRDAGEPPPPTTPPSPHAGA